MPKNIILLSDGTGNSAAKLMKTNVWHVYEALDLTDPEKQVACYDDGVGSSSFKPLAVVGGIFGVGLKRNLLRLYRFLCEHYNPGDRIFAFGFSRGALTIRILVGLVAQQGIIRTPRPARPAAAGNQRVATRRRLASDAGATSSEQPAATETATGPADAADTNGAIFGTELARLSRWAYLDFLRNATLGKAPPVEFVARKLRDAVLRRWERLRGYSPYDPRRNHQVEFIEFVGLWDMVSAYGLPIDELAQGIDKWIWAAIEV